MDIVKIDRSLLAGLLKDRCEESHKGDYGHLLLVCGCAAMPGAAVLSTGAALVSGCGLVTLHAPARAGEGALFSFPSAMLSEDPSRVFSQVPHDLAKYAAIGVGPGLGKAPETVEALGGLLAGAKACGIPMLLDADALNIISATPGMMDSIPEGSVMTPHVGELKRLTGWDGTSDKDAVVLELCRRTGSVVVSKGYHTHVCMPDGTVYENTTGNAGMAKGGSGDVLTGLISGLMARGYSAHDAALLGVWLHGYAGDALTAERTAECYSSRDLIDKLYLGFKALYDR